MKCKNIKKTLIIVGTTLLIILFSFTGCVSNMVETLKEAEKVAREQREQVTVTDTASATSGTEETVVEGVVESEVLAQFKSMIEADRKPVELIDYLDENIPSVSEDTAAIMMEDLESHQKIYERKYTDILFEGNTQEKLVQTFSGDIERTEIDMATDPGTKDLLAEIYGGGFRLIGLEGSYYPFIDYEFLKKYNQYLPEEFINYHDVMAAESNEISSRDAALVISWDELAERTINSEVYLIDYPEDTIRKVNVADLYMIYLRSYLFGQSNTPNRDVYNTNQVYDEVLESYRKTAQQYPETQTGQIIVDYLKLLEENDFVVSDDMLDLITDYLKRPIAAYNLDSPALIKQKVKNMYYTSDLSSFGYILLVNGEYREQYDVESVTELVIVLPDEYIAIGDIDGDNINDAAVILVADPGGSGTFYYLHAVINGYSFFYDAAADVLGDRVKVKSLNIAEGGIYIDMVIHGPDDPMCCPTEEVSRIYKYEDNQLFKLISHTGTVDELNETLINIIIESGALLQIMLEGYELPEEITEGSSVYVEYYTDYIAEQNIIQFIELLEE